MPEREKEFLEKGKKISREKIRRKGAPEREARVEKGLTPEERREKKELERFIKEQQSLSTSSDDDRADEAVKEVERLEKDSKVQKLVSVAHKEGLFFATKVAKKSKDAYLVDAFHDKLIKDGTYKKFKE